MTNQNCDLCGDVLSELNKYNDYICNMCLSGEPRELKIEQYKELYKILKSENYNKNQEVFKIPDLTGHFMTTINGKYYMIFPNGE